MFYSTKTYGHSTGLSCAFRQWRAESHCRLLHGYALKIRIVFKSETLDARNWVVDFGGLKSLKGILEDAFDHKTVVAEDDPELDTFIELEKKGLIDLRILPDVGCEKFAEYVAGAADTWLDSNGYRDVSVHTVEVSEHEGNSAIWGAE